MDWKNFESKICWENYLEPKIFVKGSLSREEILKALKKNFSKKNNFGIEIFEKNYGLQLLVFLTKIDLGKKILVSISGTKKIQEKILEGMNYSQRKFWPKNFCKKFWVTNF